MADRALRGARLGGQSFEDERGIEFAPRVSTTYTCPTGHVFSIAFSDEAEVPAFWECPRCGEAGESPTGVKPEEKAVKPQRTHWDMLRERRSIPELEEILSERISMLRDGEIGPAHLHRASRRKRASKA